MKSTLKMSVAALTLMSLFFSMTGCHMNSAHDASVAECPPVPAATALFFHSPQEAVEKTAQLIKAKDWVTLAGYYDLTGRAIHREELESGKLFWRPERPATAHPGMAWQYIQPFTPGFEFDHAEPVDLSGIVRVELKIRIDQGGGQQQIGTDHFELRKSDKGYQLLLKADVAGKQPTTAGTAATPTELSLFRPSLADRVAQLPPATTETLGALLDGFNAWKRRAAIAPLSGITKTTHVAGVSSYEASNEELMLSEVGRRIEQVLSENPPAKVQAALETSGRTEIHLKYSRIDVHHVDVIGTGRVYVANPPLPVEIAFKKMTPH